MEQNTQQIKSLNPELATLWLSRVMLHDKDQVGFLGLTDDKHEAALVADYAKSMTVNDVKAFAEKFAHTKLDAYIGKISNEKLSRDLDMSELRGTYMVKGLDTGTDRVNELSQKLQAALAEVNQLKKENTTLKEENTAGQVALMDMTMGDIMAATAPTSRQAADICIGIKTGIDKAVKVSTSEKALQETAKRFDVKIPQKETSNAMTSNAVTQDKSNKQSKGIGY